MEILTSAVALRSVIDALKRQGSSIGFVPTMGALHDGHMALVAAALVNCDFVICSIFVNPTQFNNANDLHTYPKTPDEDVNLLKNAGCNLLFLPEGPNEIYPHAVASMTFDLGTTESVMEGAFRPGHFQGVATVLYHFFQLISPDNVFMGEKDFQQVAVVKRLVEIMGAPIEVIGVPTKRNASGLALSSRNLRLSPEAIKQASTIFKSLLFAKENYAKFSPTVLAEKMNAFFQGMPNANVEYITFADSHSLVPINNWHEHQSIRVFIVVWIDGVRLIDNLLIF